MKVYKLTNAQGRTHRFTQWGADVEHRVDGDIKMCHNGLHCYASPELAVMLDPIYGDYLRTVDAQLWECEAGGEQLADGFKSCHRWVRTIRRIEIPDITTTQRAAFAILCVLGVSADAGFQTWAAAWFSGLDRSYDGACDICAPALEVCAARAAICAAMGSYAPARSVVFATAHAATAAALVSQVTKKPIDFVTLAKKAMEC